jgi:hypothetical protein
MVQSFHKLVQVGIFGDIAKWQRDLDRLSNLYDTDEEGGLHTILQGAAARGVPRLPTLTCCTANLIIDIRITPPMSWQGLIAIRPPGLRIQPGDLHASACIY